MKKPGKFTFKKPDLISPLKTRSFRVGGYSVVAFIIVAAIAVVVNIIANALPASITQFDTTSTQLFTISEQTEKILSNLDDEVDIYWVVQSGQEDTTVGTLLDRYEALGEKVTVTKKDPDVYPTFVEQYATGTVYNNSLIVVSGDRSTYVSYSDIYEYDYSNYYSTGSYDVSFAGESVLTSAIDYVTSDSLPVVYTLTGHGETTLSDDYQSAIARENIQLEELSLITSDSVPEDADCVLIVNPQSDISDQELEMLREYLAAGGDMLLITAPLKDGSTLDNISLLMADYGVSPVEGVVIEGSSTNYAYGMSYYLLPNYTSHTVTDPLIDSGYYVLMPIAQGLEVSDELPDSVSVTELLTTSNSAYSKVAGYSMTTYEKEDGDIAGGFALAVAITDTIDSETSSNIVWFSSSAIVDDSTNSMVSGGNQDLFLNAIGWMCDQENTISIHSKSLSYDYLTMDSGTSSLISILVVGVIPLAFLGVGIYIRVRRKRV